MNTYSKSTTKCKTRPSVPRYEVGFFVPMIFDNLTYYYLAQYHSRDDSYLVHAFNQDFEYISSNYYAEEYLVRNISKKDFTKEEQINLMFVKNKIDLTWEA